MNLVESCSYVWDPSVRTVVFVLVDDSDHVGFVTNSILEDGDDVLLDYTLSWTRRGDGGPPTIDMQPSIEAAVENHKALAEARVANG